MNTERYNQKLNQIREKYGRPSDKNPRYDQRERSYNREHTPLQIQMPLNRPQSNYELPPKPYKKQLKIESQTPSRRQKQNIPAAPLSLIKDLSPRNQYSKQKQMSNFPEKMMKTSYDFLQSQRPSISQNYRNVDLSPKPAYKKSEQSSPIRKLQFELQGVSTQRQYGNNIERPFPTTPSKINVMNSTQFPSNLHFTERSPFSKADLTQNFKQIQTFTPIVVRSPLTPNGKESIKMNFRRQQQFQTQAYPKQSNQYSDQQSGKANFSVNNINKIQERIQMILNGNKK